MASSPEEMRFAIDDARRRHAAVVDLIAANDRQALGFLQLYVALAGGALSGAAAILLARSATLPCALGFGLVGFAVPLIVGSVFCVAAVWPSYINLPGRKPDFWIMASDQPIDKVYIAYLENLAVQEAKNSELNFKLSRLMLAAKLFGVVAPIAGAVAGVASWLGLG